MLEAETRVLDRDARLIPPEMGEMLVVDELVMGTVVVVGGSVMGFVIVIEVTPVHSLRI